MFNHSDEKFNNWIKSGLSFKYARDGLQSFVFDEIRTFQQKSYADILKAQSLPEDTSCSSCNTESIVCEKCNRGRCAPNHKVCPKYGLCNHIKNKILNAHMYHGPSWRNTDARQWFSDPWEVAKCYMPKEGYLSKTVDNTDFNGIVSVILNHKNFSQKLSAGSLTRRDNIFRKAQNVAKDFRHTASFEVEDEDFKNILDILTTVLNEKEIAEYQSAKYALQKFKELRDLQWTIFTSNDDIFSVMKTACESEKSKPDNTEGKQKQEMLQLAVKIIEANSKADTKSLVCQMQNSFSTYQDEQKKNKFRKGLREKLLKMYEVECSPLPVSALFEDEDAPLLSFYVSPTMQRLEILDLLNFISKNLRKKLVRMYEVECSTLPVSALFEDEDAPLLSFYVSPTMQQVEYHKIRKKSTSIKSYYDIFHKDGQPCRNIYITGDAGSGKTAICQKMVLCWCHAHRDGRADDNFSQEDINTMKSFDFLFFVSLRDTEDCHVSAMIQQQLVGTDLAELIDQILEEEKCLIILDGLDEWTHPISAVHCPKNKKIPHRDVRLSCVYLTTSRPWKLEAERLKTTEIDQQIEIKGLDRIASDKLTSYVVEHLNEKYQEDRSIEDFKLIVERKKQFESVSEIPIIKIQLISLWFKDANICSNFSRCAIYANTLEMLFSRAVEREQENPKSSLKTDKIIKRNNMTQSFSYTPVFILDLPLFQDLLPILYKTGQLAFDMLFRTPEGESGLVFRRNVGQKYDLQAQETDFLLQVGILSKNKVIGPQTCCERLIKLTFLHKSYQEFMAALYITMTKDHGSLVNQMFTKCKSMAEFLKYEQMFVFLSGMCVEVMDKVSVAVRNMVSADSTVKEFRQTAHYMLGVVVFLKPYNNLADQLLERARNGEGSLRALQSLMLRCLEESRSCKNKGIQLPLTDVFIGNDYNSDLKELLGINRDNIKSVSMERYIDDLDSLDMLEKIVINENNYSETSRDNVARYQGILSSSASLKSLSLAVFTGQLSMFTRKINSLSSLSLYDVNLSHDEILNLLNFISNSIALIQLLLCNVRCLEHVNGCSGGVLNLSNHSKLKCVRLQKLFEYLNHETYVNNSELQLLVLQDDLKSMVAKYVVRDIQNAPKLTELDLVSFNTPAGIDIIVSILPTLKSLERLILIDFDFGERILQMNTENEQPIKMVSFLNTSLSFQSFCAFVDSLPKTSVIVSMQVCKITRESSEKTEEENFTEAANYVRANGSFEVTMNYSRRLDFCARD